MEVIFRSHCAATHAKDLELLYTFKKFPVFMGCTTQAETQDLTQDMSWWISKSSGLIQLNPLLPLDVLYPESHGAGVVGALWAAHHKAFAKFIHNAKPKSTFEIGGSHGILELEYQRFGAIPWTILEPNPDPAPGTQARFIRGFFDASFKLDEDYDIVVHSHVFEHMYEPAEFMQQLASFIPTGKQLAFSLPNMQVMLERNYTNCINFEHTVFLSETYVEYLLAVHGFEVSAKEFFKEDHSIFYLATKTPKPLEAKLSGHMYTQNSDLYKGYLSFHKNLVRELNARMASLDGPIYLFGAHVFAQYLLAFGLNTDKIKGLLDNDSNKHGKRLYGSALTVSPPKVLREDKHPTVILRAGVYNQEIQDDILSNINANTQFLK